jgi:hypothetical protein
MELLTREHLCSVPDTVSAAQTDYRRSASLTQG